MSQEQPDKGLEDNTYYDANTLLPDLVMANNITGMIRKLSAEIDDHRQRIDKLNDTIHDLNLLEIALQQNGMVHRFIKYYTAEYREDAGAFMPTDGRIALITTPTLYKNMQLGDYVQATDTLPCTKITLDPECEKIFFHTADDRVLAMLDYHEVQEVQNMLQKKLVLTDIMMKRTRPPVSNAQDDSDDYVVVIITVNKDLRLLMVSYVGDIEEERVKHTPLDKTKLSKLKEAFSITDPLTPAKV